MRGAKAKKIRKSVCGDMTSRARKYAVHKRDGHRINTGLRAAYLKAKKNASE